VKQKKCLILLIVCIVIAMSGMAGAETLTAHGLTLSLKTDKESYVSGETITCCLDMVNNSEEQLAVTCVLELPDTFQPAAALREVLYISPGGKESHVFSALVKARGADVLPATGDVFPFCWISALLVLSVAAGIWLIGGMRVMAAILVCAMAAGSFSLCNEALADPSDMSCQTEYGANLSEEEHLKALAEQKQMILAAAQEEEPQLLQASEAFEVNRRIAIDGQLVVIKVTGFVQEADSSATAAVMKALGRVSLKPVAILGKTKFKLTWSKVPGATHYEVWHSDGSGYIKRATTIGTSWTTNYGKYGVINTYKVRAITKEGNLITAKGPYATRTCYGMAQPTISKVEHTSSTSTNVRISWNAASYCTGYYVYRSFTGESGTYSLIGKSSSTSFIDQWRNGYYKIRPYYAAANGITYSGPASDLKSMPAQYRALLIGQTDSASVSAQGSGNRNNTEAFRIMLGSTKAPAYRPADTMVYHNLTTPDVLTRIKTAFQRAKAGDVSLFYFSGKGDSDGLFCNENGEERLSFVQLKEALDAVPGKKLVILEASCSGSAIDQSRRDSAIFERFNNAVGSVFVSGDQRANLVGTEYYVLTACSREQTAAEMVFVMNRKRMGIFTSQLLNGSGINSLTNAVQSELLADVDGDGQLTLHEVYTYTNDAVASVCDDLGYEQDIQVYPTYSSQVLWGR